MRKHVWTIAAGLLAFLAFGLVWYLNTPKHPPTQTVALPQSDYLDAGELLHLTELLSNDALEGRRIGTPGNEAARPNCGGSLNVQGTCAARFAFGTS